METAIAAWWLALGIYLGTFHTSPPAEFINSNGILMETIAMQEAVETGVEIK